MNGCYNCEMNWIVDYVQLWGFMFESLPCETVSFLGMAQVLPVSPNQIHHISNTFGAEGIAVTECLLNLNTTLCYK